MTFTPPRSRIGIVTALPIEAACLVGRRVTPGRALRLNDRMSLYVGGIGAARARAATQELLHQGVSHLLSWGVAGGLSTRLPAGMVVLPERIIGANGTCVVDGDWRRYLWAALSSSVDVCGGDIAQVPSVLTSSDDKIRLGQTTGAVAADMESLAVAEVAREAGVVFAAIRAIADTANQNLPACAVSALRPDGGLRVSHLAAQIFKRPAELGELMYLGRRMRQACRALRAVARVVPDLAPGLD